MKFYAITKRKVKIIQKSKIESCRKQDCAALLQKKARKSQVRQLRRFA